MFLLKKTMPYKQIIRLEPRLPQTYYWLAKAQYLWKEYKSAKINFKKSIQLGFSGIEAYAALVNIALIKDNISQAMQNTEVLIKFYPDKALSYELKGDVYMAKNKPQLAAQFYNKALEKEQLAGLIKKRYLADIKFKENDQAQQAVADWLVQYPDNLELRQSLAIAYIEDKKYKKAITHFEIILKKQPKNSNIINNLALLYDKVGNPKSIEYAEIAYSLAPDQPAILDTLGWLLLKRNYNKRAADLLYKAFSKDPFNPGIRYHYAKALVSIGDNKNAAKHLNSIIEDNDHFENKRNAEELLNKINKQ